MAKSFKSIAVIISLSLSCKSGQARPQLGRHDRQVSQDENIMTNMVKPSLVNMRGDSVEEPQPLAPSTLEAPDVATLKIDLKELNEIDSSLDKIVSVITAIKNLESMSQDLLKDVKRTTMSPVKETTQEKLDKQTKTSKKIKKSVPLDLIELYLDKILNHTNAGVKSVNLDNSDLDLIVDSAIKAFSDVDYEIFAKYTEDIKESRGKGLKGRSSRQRRESAKF